MVSANYGATQTLRQEAEGDRKRTKTFVYLVESDKADVQFLEPCTVFKFKEEEFCKQ